MPRPLAMDMLDVHYIAIYDDLIAAKSSGPCERARGATIDDSRPQRECSRQREPMNRYAAVLSVNQILSINIGNDRRMFFANYVIIIMIHVIHLTRNRWDHIGGITFDEIFLLLLSKMSRFISILYKQTNFR